ncbi:MAG: hypothetical protein HOQ05_09765 [Corynebacteriales bacterium]|nr:hypothetical protein [Mycobacteriales bacterium]
MPAMSAAAAIPAPTAQVPRSFDAQPAQSFDAAAAMRNHASVSDGGGPGGNNIATIIGIGTILAVVLMIAGCPPSLLPSGAESGAGPVDPTGHVSNSIDPSSGSTGGGTGGTGGEGGGEIARAVTMPNAAPSMASAPGFAGGF